mmetsp:Transcript_17083/g.15427  ORF Transcript_17083/g.15427 Transcript_17083/m.15427 type:complete len:274 (-) Transcript_17083:7-828(-)
MSDWFNNLASQAKKLADSIADKIVTTAEHAQEELLVEQKKVQLDAEKNNILLNNNNQSTVLLPWETTNETLAILSNDLMEKILNLSLSERNFTIIPNELNDILFDFHSYVPVIMKLLSIDINLSQMHAKFSPKMDEELFWCNYYRRTMYLRAIIGIDGDELKEKYNKFDINNIIFFSTKFEDDYINRKIKPIENITVHNESTNTKTDEEINKLKSKADDEALAAEVEEELNNDDIDLDDLDITDDKDDDYENIDDEIDIDLEEQIKKELSGNI